MATAADVLPPALTATAPPKPKALMMELSVAWREIVLPPPNLIVELSAAAIIELLIVLMAMEAPRLKDRELLALPTEPLPAILIDWISALDMALTSNAPPAVTSAPSIVAWMFVSILLMARAAPMETLGVLLSFKLAAIAKPPAREKILELSVAATLTFPSVAIVPAIAAMTSLVMKLTETVPPTPSVPAKPPDKVRLKISWDVDVCIEMPWAALTFVAVGVEESI